jgi:hypothetical protein
MTNYIAMAFRAWRGSNRYIFNMYELTRPIYTSPTVFVSHKSFNDFTSEITTMNGVTTSDMNYPAEVINFMDTVGAQGSCLQNVQINPLLPVEVPYYSNQRFSIVTDDLNLNLTSGNITEVPSLELKGLLLNTSTSETSCDISILQSVGEDFNLFFFNGFPPVYFETEVPSE